MAIKSVLDKLQNEMLEKKQQQIYGNNKWMTIIYCISKHKKKHVTGQLVVDDSGWERCF